MIGAVILLALAGAGLALAASSRLRGAVGLTAPYDPLGAVVSSAALTPAAPTEGTVAVGGLTVTSGDIPPALGAAVSAGASAAVAATPFVGWAIGLITLLGHVKAERQARTTNHAVVWPAVRVSEQMDWMQRKYQSLYYRLSKRLAAHTAVARNEERNVEEIRGMTDAELRKRIETNAVDRRWIPEKPDNVAVKVWGTYQSGPPGPGQGTVAAAAHAAEFLAQTAAEGAI